MPSYLTLLVALATILAAACAPALVGRMLRPKTGKPEGPPAGPQPPARQSVPLYRLSAIAALFGSSGVLLFAWALVWPQTAAAGTAVAGIGIFAVVLVIAFIYALRKGVLQPQDSQAGSQRASRDG